jgi:peptidyl-prolyl cis-trans isomerase SurA
MRWRSPLTSAVVGFSLVALGCDTDKPFVAAVGSEAEPGLLRTVEAMGRGDESAARAQAPDPEQSTLVAQGRPASSNPGGVQPASYTAAHVAAIVNGEAILDEEMRAAAHDMLRRLEGMPEPERSKKQAELLTQVLNALIDREVVLQDAFERIKHGPGGEKNLEKIRELADTDFERTWVRPVKEQLHIKSDEEFKAFLIKQGMSFEMQKRLRERQYMMEQYLRNRVYPITDKIGHIEIVEYYDTHPESFKVDDEIDWQDLFIAASRYQTREAAKRFAEVLAQRVRSGEDFLTLSDQFDDGDSKLRKGQGLGRKRGEIKPSEAEPVLFQLKKDEVAVIEKPNGFHVVRVVNRQYAGQLPFDEKTQRLIKDKLRNEIMQRETQRIVTELKRTAVIEVYK